MHPSNIHITWHRSILLLLLLAMLSSCATSRQLSDHRREMNRIAYSDANNKQRFDDFMMLTTTVLTEANQRPSTLKTLRYVEKFSKQNEAAIVKTTNELTAWISEMSLAEGVAFGSRLISKPYARQLLRLVPEIEQKAQSNGYQLGAIEKAFLLIRVQKLIKGKKKKRN